MMAILLHNQQLAIGLDGEIMNMLDIVVENKAICTKCGIQYTVR